MAGEGGQTMPLLSNALLHGLGRPDLGRAVAGSRDEVVGAVVEGVHASHVLLVTGDDG